MLPAMKPFQPQLSSGSSHPSFVAESPRFLAFVEASPLVEGHVVIASKREEDHLFDLSEDELGELMALAKRVARALRAAFPCVKVGTAAIGLETRHAHLHLVPISSADDLNFTRAKISLSPERVAQIAREIRARI